MADMFDIVELVMFCSCRSLAQDLVVCCKTLQLVLKMLAAMVLSKFSFDNGSHVSFFFARELIKHYNDESSV